MTTEHFEEQLHAEAPAVHFLMDTVADYLLNRGHAAKIGEIASQAGKRVGAGSKLIRQTLMNSSQFVGEERRWNLSLRTLFHRPIEGAVQATLNLYGKPMTMQAISNEMAVLNARSADFFQSFLPAFMADRPDRFFRTPDDRWALVAWLLDLSETEDADVLIMRNFFNQLDTVQPELDAATAVAIPAGASAVDAAYAVITALDHPVQHKVLSYAVWRALGEAFEPRQFYLDLLQDSRFHMLSGGKWMPATRLDAVTASLQKLSSLADAALEEEEVWEGPYVVSPDDLGEMFDYIIEHQRPEKLSDLIEAVLEYGKSSPRYQSVFDGLMEALQQDPRFQIVGQQTWSLPALVPQEALQVPETLLPEALDPTLLADPETDAELEDEGLDGSLALWVHDPRYEDFGGEHEVELTPDAESAIEETRISLLYSHRQMGTLKLRQSDMAFFPTETPMACVTVSVEGFGTVQMWINNEELLIHGLEDWYRAKELPVGAVLAFRRGDEPDDFTLGWDGEMDDLVALSEDRIEALLELRDEAEAGNWSVYEIMCRVMASHSEGIHFLTLWAEVNVVRRTPKRVIASNLSSYHCFVAISNSDKWRLDERKIEQGRKKTKKKYIIQ